jgi:hypothetical protein
MPRSTVAPPAPSAAPQPATSPGSFSTLLGSFTRNDDGQKTDEGGGNPT